MSKSPDAGRADAEGGIRPLEILVLGAGIVGLSAALYLQRDGHRVTILDPREPGQGTSFGNAGGLVISSAAPLAMPGFLRSVPKLLFNSRGPLMIRWGYLPQIAPWLFDLLRASRPDRVERAAAAITALGDQVEAAWRDLSQQAGLQHLLLPRGWLKVYEAQSAFEAVAAERDLARRHGRKLQVLSADELRQLEPNLAPIFCQATFDAESNFLVNPLSMTNGLAAAFLARGGQILQEAAQAIEDRAPGLAVRCESGPKPCDRVVVAAGAWSKTLVKGLGVRPRLDSERGYHLMLDTPEKGIARPVVCGDDYFALSPMEGGLRLVSGVEFAGLTAPPDYRRVEGLLGRAKRMLPSLKTDIQSRWLGFRPSHPDSLPVIGPTPQRPAVICAFGHGHLGMSHGPPTGRIVADLVAGRDPGLDMAPYAADRRIA